MKLIFNRFYGQAILFFKEFKDGFSLQFSFCFQWQEFKQVLPDILAHALSYGDLFISNHHEIMEPAFLNPGLFFLYRQEVLFALANPGFRRSPGQIAAGLIVGLLVAAGWFVTGHLGADDFNPVAVTSLTFIAPIADALQYAMLSTGLTLNFGIATVAGVFVGSLATALATGRFKLEGYSSPRHMLRSGSGAALMGIGGVMAFGCSIGQGLTGVSTLALGSFVALAGILLGTTAGLRGALRVQPLQAAEARSRAA